MGTDAPEAPDALPWRVSQGSADGSTQDSNTVDGPVWLMPLAPLAVGVGAWAIATYTRDSLGAWRYLLVVPLALYAGVMALAAVVFVFTAWASRPEHPTRRRWVGRLPRALPVLVLATMLAAVVEFAYRWNHDGPLKAVEKFPWVSLVIVALVLHLDHREHRGQRWRFWRLLADVPAAQADQAEDGQDRADGGHDQDGFGGDGDAGGARDGREG